MVKRLLLIVLMLVVTGCSTKFTYNNLNWLVYWYLDDYVELTSTQKTALDQKLYDWQLWHRYEELPKYQTQLNQLKEDIASQKLTLARLEYHHQQMLEHWQRLKQKAVPDLVAMASMLSEQQINQLFTELDKRNTEKRDELLDEQTDLSQQKQDRLAERNKKLKRWLGSLSSEQTQLVSSAYDEYYDNRMLWLEYRANYQTALKALLLEIAQQPDKQQQLQRRLTQDLLAPERYRSEQLVTRNQHNVTVFREFLLAMDNRLSKQQRQHLLGELDEYQQEIASLLR